MSTNGTEDDPVAEERERSPLSLTWLLSLGVIIVAILAAVITIVVVRGGEPTTQPPPSAPPPSTAPSASPSGPSSASPGPPTASGEPSSATQQPGAPNCAQVAEAEGEPILTAPPTEWELVDTLAVPTTEGGPGRVDGPLATCYTADTLGALTAAAQIYLRSNAGDGDIVREKQTTSDSQWQTEEVKEQWRTNPPQKPWFQLRAFRTGAIEDNKVVIGLQLKKPGTTQVTPVFDLTMVWTGTDWLIGRSSETPSPDTTGLILWEGV